jgi:site-specific DNA recombinase
MKKLIKNTKNQVAIYARVSSQRQKEGDTIKSQLDSLFSYAKQEGYVVNKNWIFLDDGVSGTSLQRPALDELRDMIRSEAVDCILVYSTDRLARNYSHQLILLEEFKKRGVRVCFLKNPPVGDTPEAIMLNHFQGIFAEYERALILDRSRRGKIYKAKQGNPICLPSVAYGYKRVRVGHEVKIEICEEAARVVKDIFRLYVYEKKTISEIARLLTQNGVKTANNKPGWIASSIRHMLKNTAYIGAAYFGKTEGSNGVTDRIRHYRSGKSLQPKHARRLISEEKWLPISMPAIISESDFEQAQNQLRINRELASRNTKEPSLLQGLVFCGECGNPFYKRSRRYKDVCRSYYYCRTHGDRKLKKCSNVWAYQQELDDLVYNETVKLLQNPSLVRSELSRRAKESSDQENNERQEIVCRKELLKINQERDRLLDAFQSGLIDIEGLKRRHQESDKRRNSVEKEIKRIQALKFDNENIQDLEKGLEKVLKTMKLSAENLSLKDKQKVIRLVVEKVVVSPTKVRIIHCISPQMIDQEFCQLSLNGAG